ncbi:MAG TPA: hypothetical protein PLD02_08785 [Saprospiraceae bacterium]|nr:hypothetical protein [Saprospiraceae bacterium]
MQRIARTYKTGLAKVAAQCSAETFVANQTLVLHINIPAENRTINKPETVSAFIPKHRSHRP